LLLSSRESREFVGFSTDIYPLRVIAVLELRHRQVVQPEVVNATAAVFAVRTCSACPSGVNTKSSMAMVNTVT
jgi:hypothetical protein